MSSQPGKDTIYIDVDDEITAIIDKIRSSHEKIVALVLPKRATVFQSIVNMKLLKRTADDAKKHLVLITSEAGLLPLAGSVGIYVAKSLQSKPEVPVAPDSGAHAPDDSEEAVDMSLAREEKLDPTRPVGEYAGAAAMDDDAPIELDDTPDAAAAKDKKKPKKGGKKFAIPDFNKFRTWIVLGGVGLVVFIFMWYMAFSVMPRSTITVKTDSTAVRAALDITFDTEAQDVAVDEDMVPAVLQTTQKTANQQVEATGQKDNGTKATGELTMSAGACTGSQPNSVPAGTGVVANGLTFITTEATSFVPKLGGGKCTWSSSSATAIVAQNNGSNYNIAATSYTVAGRSDVTATGTATTGGTSQIVKVISQADIDNAKQKITGQDTAAVRTELKQALESQGLFVVDATFTPGANPEVTTSGKVGDEAANVTVTQKTTYTMFGVKQADLKKIVTNAVSDKIDTTKQSIIDFGLEEATFKLQNQQAKTALVSLDTTAIAGSDLNLDEIKKQVAGKKANDAKEIISKYPGVTEVNVRYSPFWVKSIPKKEGKITVTVEKPTVNNAKQQ